VPVRHVLLGALAVVVFGLTVYLFLEVRSSPAAPSPRSAPVANAKDEKDEPARDEKEPETAPPKPRPSDSRRGGPGAISRMGRKAQAGSGVEPTPTVAPPVPDAKSTVKLDAMMAEANKAYDKQDYDEAKTIARKVLLQSPNNARMLRILVSTACVDHDLAEAQKNYNLLTDPSDRQVMRTRCQRDFGITLNDTVK
jgi:hypothetical protein